MENLSYENNYVFDKNEVLNRIGEDIDFLIKITKQFSKEWPSLLSNIETAIEQNDSKSLTYAAHTLKGTAGELSAKAVYEAALSLEMIGHKGDFTHAKESYDKLSKELDNLKEAFVKLETGI